MSVLLHKFNRFFSAFKCPTFPAESIKEYIYADTDFSPCGFQVQLSGSLNKFRQEEKQRKHKKE